MATDKIQITHMISHIAPESTFLLDKRLEGAAGSQGLAGLHSCEPGTRRQVTNGEEVGLGSTRTLDDGSGAANDRFQHVVGGRCPSP